MTKRQSSVSEVRSPTRLKVAARSEDDDCNSDSNRSDIKKNLVKPLFSNGLAVQDSKTPISKLPSFKGLPKINNGGKFKKNKKKA